MNNKNIKIAYFSAEIGLSSSLPTYSGGLGVLAGDHIKASADAGIEMLGISLLYKEGYFKQLLDKEGNQKEEYPRFELGDNLSLLPNKFSIKIRGREVWIQAYEYLHTSETGHIIPIYFLDTDIDENISEDRMITLRLYSGDKNHRILQESILGFGGIRFLDAYDFDSIEKFHMNEGHSSFLTLALLEKYKKNEEKVKSMCHFTTHTPVAAGHDNFSTERCSNILNSLMPNDLNLPSIKDNRLHMTELGLYYSNTANGVSKLHGKVAQDQFPDFDIDYITNGVYHPHWIGDSFAQLFNDYFKNWKMDPNLLLNVDNIDNEKIISAHKQQKDELINYANLFTENKLSSDVLTIGFARRAAEYKRAGLIFSNVEKLIEIGSGKIQMIFSGKAHPNDIKGKQIIKEVVNNAHQLVDEVNIVFLENYNMHLGRLITSGVDLWLNTPIRPNEASGTSGMKAALNGVPNFSVIDGWWAEGCKDNENGWAIGSPDSCNDIADAESLYFKLENQIINTFYNDKIKWTQIMKNSIKTGVDFTAHRMVNDYKDKFYI